MYNIYFTYFQVNNAPEVNDKLAKNFNTDIISFLKEFKIDGATLAKNTGIWLGETEQSYKLELLDVNKDVVVALCNRLKEYYKQDSVLYTYTPLEYVFV